MKHQVLGIRKIFDLELSEFRKLYILDGFTFDICTFLKITLVKESNYHSFQILQIHLQFVVQEAQCSQSLLTGQLFTLRLFIISIYIIFCCILIHIKGIFFVQFETKYSKLNIFD